MKNSPDNQKYLFEQENHKEIKFPPFYHTKFKDSLEKIVFKNKSETRNTILDNVFSDKQKTLAATIKSLLDEIHLREELDLHLLNKINEDRCWQKTQLINLENLNVNYIFEWFNEINKHKIKIENNILDLEKEKRKEYLECWRDLMFLKKYLMSALKDFWELTKKQNLLTGNLNQQTENEDRKRYRGTL
jgi:hypothetical protein